MEIYTTYPPISEFGMALIFDDSFSPSCIKSGVPARTRSVIKNPLPIPNPDRTFPRAKPETTSTAINLPGGVGLEAHVFHFWVIYHGEGDITGA